MMTEPMESPQLDVVVTGEIALSPVDLEAMAQAAEAAELERIGKLRALLIRLCAKRDQAICAKRDIECAMANSLRLYYGMSRLMEATKAQPVSGGVDSERTLKPGLCVRGRIVGKLGLSTCCRPIRGNWNQSQGRRNSKPMG